MIELQQRPQFNVVLPSKLLQEGYLVTFTDKWPSTEEWIYNKTFRVEAANQVPYPLSYIIPTGDYKDVDLSNNDDGEQIYPTAGITLEEVTMGFKPGNYIVHFYVPSGKALNQLEFAQMYPNLSDSHKLYLGAKRPEDSPADDPQIKMYIPKGVTPIILRPYVLPGVDYEKVVIELVINKCRLAPVEAPSEDDLRKAKVIRYYDELRW